MNVLRSDYIARNATLTLVVQHKDIASVPGSVIYLNNLEPNESLSVQIKALGAGKTDIYSNISTNTTE